MSYVIPAFFGKYLFSDGKMGMMGCPNIYGWRLATTKSDGIWNFVVDHWTSDGESSSHRGVVLLHGVWTTSNRLSGYEIT
jgi:hypothetical protein